MTEKDFTNRIDGLINDYEGGESNSKELRDGILDTLIELLSKVSPFEARVSPACETCKYLHIEEATNGEDLELCCNPHFQLYNLTNCGILTNKFGCTYHKSKSG